MSNERKPMSQENPLPTLPKCVGATGHGDLEMLLRTGQVQTIRWKPYYHDDVPLYTADQMRSYAESARAQVLVQVRQADERGDDALRRAHAAEAELEGHNAQMTRAIAKINTLEKRGDLYSELADAIGCDCMDAHAGRLDIARRLKERAETGAQVLEVLRELVAASDAWHTTGTPNFDIFETGARLAKAWERARSLLNPEA